MEGRRSGDGDSDSDGDGDGDGDGDDSGMMVVIRGHLGRQCGKARKALVGNDDSICEAVAGLRAGNHAAVVFEHTDGDEIATDD